VSPLVPFLGSATRPRKLTYLNSLRLLHSIEDKDLNTVGKKIHVSLYLHADVVGQTLV
jgi:hypothetical protein